MTKKTCTQCLNLNTCRLKAIILNPNISSCNYAQEGCIRYKVKRLHRATKEKILHLLQNNSEVTIQLIHTETGLPIRTKSEKQIIWNAVNRLIKKGYDVKKFNAKSKSKEITYALA